MYHIDSQKDKPDIQFMLNKLTELVHNRGIIVKDIRSMRAEVQEQANVLENELRLLTGIANPRSSAQVKAYFLGLNDKDVEEICTDPITGKVSVGKEALAKMADIGRDDAILMQKCREAQSKLNTFKSLMEYTGSDNRIHPNVSLQISNRISYSNPALMNIHKELLWDIVQAEPGKVLWSIDIKNQEPHIIAYMLGIQEIMDIIESGTGLYESLFAKIFPNEEITKVKRKEFKTLWNALTYGGGFKLAEACTEIDGKEVWKFFKGLKGMKEHQNRCKQLSQEGKNRISSYFGTVLESDKVGYQLERSLSDLAIQGTGADILALLIKRFYDLKEQSENGKYFDIYYSRHDELIVQVDASVPDSMAELVLRDLFTHKVDNWKEFGLEVQRLT